MNDAPAAPEQGSENTKQADAPANNAAERPVETQREHQTASDARNVARTPESLGDGSFLADRLKEEGYFQDFTGSKGGPETSKRSTTEGSSDRHAAKADKPDNKGVRDIAYRRDAADRSISAAEMRERSEVANFASGIGFRFDSADVIPEQLDKFWDSLTTSERELLKNPETDAVVYGHASRPGDRSVNAVLSEARADAFAEGLREKGARARIETVGQGERWAMQDGWLEDMDKADYRVAVLRIEPPFTDSFDFEGDVIEGSMLVTRWSEFNQDREQGKQIVQRLLDDVAAEVRKEASLPENPISKAGIAKDLVKGDLARALVKSIVGGTIDALTGTQAKEVWAVRQESYRAWAKGIASVLDPRGGHGTDGMSERERKYFDKGRSSVANLDEVQKYQAHLSLIDNVRLNSFQPQVADFTYFSERWSGGAILTGAAVHPNGYERSDYRYR